MSRMQIAQVTLVLLIVACGNRESSSAKPAAASASTSAPAPEGSAAPAPSGSAAPARSAVANKLVLGDATVYELVSRKWERRDPPVKELVMYPDGKVELLADKSGEVMLVLFVKPDGTVTFEDGKPIATIGEREITPAGKSRLNPLVIDGDTIIVTIEAKQVKVVLAEDGNITVLDRPDGNKWRIDAKDPAVRRTAFRVLGLQMQMALD
jgi:hypothetical protein